MNMTDTASTVGDIEYADDRAGCVGDYIDETYYGVSSFPGRPMAGTIGKVFAYHDGAEIWQRNWLARTRATQPSEPLGGSVPKSILWRRLR